MAGEPGRVGRYRDLVAWQKSMALVKQVYQASSNWPRMSNTA